MNLRPTPAATETESLESAACSVISEDHEATDHGADASGEAFSGDGADLASPIDHPSAQTGVINVMHVVNGENYAGAARVQDLLAARLPDFGFGITFACVKPNRFPQLRKTKSAPLYETPMKTGFDIRPAWQVARLVRFTNAQIIHAHTPRSILIGRVASMLTGVPLVFHVHSPTARDSSRPLQNLVNDRIERWCAKGAQRLICVSQSLADHMQNLGFDQQQVVVAANGVPRLPWCERDTPSGRWTLGTVALIRPRKGIETLLRAIAKMREKGNDVVLNAVGPFETESYESEVKSLTAELGLSDAVQWIGMTRDVNAELAKMDLFALPSLYGEGMPMVVLEAMAAGLPVVATRVEGVPELVRDGIDGLLASPNSADELAACIGRFVRGEADWHRMRRAAFTRQSADFSDESMARLVASTYRQVLGDLAP